MVSEDANVEPLLGFLAHAFKETRWSYEYSMSVNAGSSVISATCRGLLHDGLAGAADSLLAAVGHVDSRPPRGIANALACRYGGKFDQNPFSSTRQAARFNYLA